MWLFFSPHQQLVVEILQRVSGAGVDAFILMSAWPTAALDMALGMAVACPVLVECTEGLLAPPETYAVHRKVTSDDVRWWTHRQQAMDKLSWREFVRTERKTGGLRGRLAREPASAYATRDSKLANILLDRQPACCRYPRDLRTTLMRVDAKV